MNLKLIDYGISSLWRRFWNRFTVILIFSLLVFLLVSVFSISSSIRLELGITLEALPELIVQKMNGGRQTVIPSERAYEIATIPGVNTAIPRVWGYYYFGSANVNFTVIGQDPDLDSYKAKYSKLFELNASLIDTLTTPFFLAGQGVVEIMDQYYFRDEFFFITANGNILNLALAGTFSDESSLETNDVILMPEYLARELFDIYEDDATDIVVRVSNPAEIEIVKQKIQFMYPDCRIISKDQIESSYQNVFDYKSGLFLALLIPAFMAFFTMVYDKASGLSLEEKREIGIMKAVGWRVEDVLILKLLESGFISLFSYFSGVALSFFFVYTLDAPLLKNLFIGAGNLKPAFQLTPVIDVHILSLSFMAIVPVYILATIIPAWRTAIIDADEVMR
ncbi:MAG: FtsX-like permease family protein [Candidatus Marinimicrobia bacterium]|nr:FtsX-like permease family protein [Candidatus Neomarinimicrobiota bacterium]